MLGSSYPDAHIVVKLHLDGEEYDVEKFQIGFAQPSDYKGQPQHELKGGQLVLTLTQIASKALYLWAKSSTSRKDGEVIFQTDMGKTVLRINFEDAYCVSLTREMNAFMGTTTSLIISPSKVKLNGRTHNNEWN